MSYEIQPVITLGFEFDPQIGSNVQVANGDVIDMFGANPAITVESPAPDQLQFRLVLDPAANNLASITVNGLFVGYSFTASGTAGTPQAIDNGNTLAHISTNNTVAITAGPTDQLDFAVVVSPTCPGNLLSVAVDGLCANFNSIPVAGITDTNDAWYLLGEDSLGNPLKYQLAASLVPFGGTSSQWSADIDYRYFDLGPGAGRLHVPVYRTTAPATAGSDTGTFNLINSTTGDMESFGLQPDQLAVGAPSLSGNIAPLQAQACAAVSLLAINGLAVDPTTGYWANGRFVERLIASTHTANFATTPTANQVYLVSAAAGNVVVTLTTPGACEPNHFYIKKTDTTANTITLTPASGLIDGSASFVFNGVAGNAGEDFEIFYDGANWWIL